MKKVLILWSVLFCFVSFGQNKKPLFLTFSTKGGIIMAHRPFMAHLVQGNAYGFEVSLSKQMADETINGINSKYPLNGLTFEYRNFGYDAVLGKAFSIIQYQGFPIFQTKKNLVLDFKMGAGIGYITKIYDKFTNPTNNAIGSHVNAKVSFKLVLNKFTKKHHFGLGVELSHFSNGAIQVPNLGLNGLSAYVNMGYNFNKREVFNPLIKRYSILELKGAYFMVEGILSVGEVLPVPLDSKKYPIFASRLTWVKPLKSNLWNVEVAFDAVYNVSNLHRYYDSTFVAKDVPQFGFYAGMSFNYYKSQIIFGMGYYVMDKINPLGRIYNRVGYRYYFTDQFFGLFSIRANFGKADFFEFGVGYKFRK